MSITLKNAGDSAVLLELDATISAQVNARVIAIARAVRERNIAGIRDVVPTYRSVAVYFDPLVVSAEQIVGALEEVQVAPAQLDDGRLIDVPVVYGGEAGPDLQAVADVAGLSPAKVIHRHASRIYRVFMLGFLPGFAYMGIVDEAIAAPRHATPRLRVAAGSVGIAGRQTGIYPFGSPGGWQIIGRTSLRLFDTARGEPALFAPGDRVRFVPVETGRVRAISEERAAPVTTYSEAATPGKRLVTVIEPGLFTTVQDEGRWTYQSIGVSVCGAMDTIAHRLANAAIGNDRTAATLEITIQGPHLRFEHPATIAITGADLQPTLDGASIPMGTAVPCGVGAVLRFGQRQSGARAYVAFDGGIAVPAVLGSRATHMITRLGGVDGRHLRAGDVLTLGESEARTDGRRRPCDHVPTGGARLRAIPGPQDGVFGADAFDALTRSTFFVGSQSNRMGFRLERGEPIRRADATEMISDATFTGGLQILPSGDPILLMADRQTVGGYPQMATVITADLPIAAQLAPGDWVQFELCTREQAVAALAAQEARLRALA